MTTADRVLAAAAGYVLAAGVAGRREGPVVCPWRRLTGHRCPACGLTRSIGRTSRLDLTGARAAHPAGPAVAVTVLALTVIRLRDRLGRR
ncbi:DUF2752 domain-containing protein [Actinomycetospora aeridis]|uniref:DUF2752 domain-containing protein n=1 Tax=Actinomycetospora aeridis TaxID=3129231 RepID=A0ABU8N385_9PSEU